MYLYELKAGDAFEFNGRYYLLGEEFDRDYDTGFLIVMFASTGRRGEILMDRNTEVIRVS